MGQRRTSSCRRCSAISKNPSTPDQRRAISQLSQLQNAQITPRNLVFLSDEQDHRERRTRRRRRRKRPLRLFSAHESLSHCPFECRREISPTRSQPLVYFRGEHRTFVTLITQRTFEIATNRSRSRLAPRCGLARSTFHRAPLAPRNRLASPAGDDAAPQFT